GASIASLVTSHSPEPFVEPVEAHVSENAQASVQQLHVFPFGGLAETARWLTHRGSWDGNARAQMAGLAKPKPMSGSPNAATVGTGGVA
ncbi:MAG: hypothetical protein AAFR23_09710, partial [Pseudomonadota bacterium]